MKTRIILVQLFLLFILISCTKQENDKIDDGITFRYYDLETETTLTLVYYNEILGYDSTKYAFLLDDLAWGKLKKKITQANLFVHPFPDFVINITLNNNLIYRAGYVPSYSSSSKENYDKILFRLQKPNIVSFRTLSMTEKFTAEDFRNDPKLIERLNEDNKLIELEN